MLPSFELQNKNVNTDSVIIPIKLGEGSHGRNLGLLAFSEQYPWVERAHLGSPARYHLGLLGPLELKDFGPWLTLTP